MLYPSYIIYIFPLFKKWKHDVFIVLSFIDNYNQKVPAEGKQTWKGKGKSIFLRQNKTIKAGNGIFIIWSKMREHFNSKSPVRVIVRSRKLFIMRITSPVTGVI
jgi:hypothetical protein